jgi:hypothetical protein
MYAKLLSAASAAILLSLFCIDLASAAGGCGAGFHRGPAGGCQPNGPVVVAPVAPVVVAPAVVAPAAMVCGAALASPAKALRGALAASRRPIP